ncbi:MAG: YeeE/YedE thiosulfate transporter family protein [Dokdonella sp.]
MRFASVFAPGRRVIDKGNVDAGFVEAWSVPLDIAVLATSFLTAVLLAGVMGYAIQRGGTCTVGAIEQLIHEHRCQRFLSILEAGVWVLAGLFIARALGLSINFPAGYPVGAMTIVGGVLLGLGAFVNGACVFGSVARIGSGQWSYIATPLGFFLGCCVTGAVLAERPGAPIAYVEPSPRLVAAIAIALCIGLGWRVSSALLRYRRRNGVGHLANLWQAFTRHVWEPDAATCVIGIAFVGMLLLVGAWTYTDVLADLARGAPMSLLARGLLLLVLFAGALLGGYSAGRFRPARLEAILLLRCLCGGALMGIGGGLVPGGNDGLLLIGMPLLWPYAWIAFAAMAVTIAAAMLWTSILARWRA